MNCSTAADSFTIAAGHNGSAEWKNVWNILFFIGFVYFRKSVEVSGTWISRRNQEVLLTFINEALVKHVVDCASDEGSGLKVNWSRKRFVKVGVVKLFESFLFVMFTMLKDKFVTFISRSENDRRVRFKLFYGSLFRLCEIGMVWVCVFVIVAVVDL